MGEVETIHDVKLKILEETGMNVSEQNLFCNYVLQENENTLKSKSSKKTLNLELFQLRACDGENIHVVVKTLTGINHVLSNVSLFCILAMGQRYFA